jgi:hypothetical protein
VKHIIIALLALITLSVDSPAWGTAVYEKAAEHVCGEYNCGCMNVMKEAVMLPETTFRDGPRHHCYNSTLRYGNQSIDFWKTPSSKDCPALESMEAWLNKSKGQTGCQFWRSIGIALHYFLDSKEFWNTVVEANKTCVREFEEMVDDYVKYGGGEWEACRCLACTTDDELKGMLAEYTEKIRLLVKSRHYSKPRVLILANTIDHGNAKGLETYLRLKGVDVKWTNASEFKAQRTDELIVILGGQNSPEGVGEIVSSILTEEEANNIITSRLTGKTHRKLDVWASMQTVIIYAGYEAEQTAETALDAREKIRGEALNILDKTSLECTKTEDCGSEYYGIPVCKEGVATRILYRPSCKNNKCVVKAVRASTQRCSYNAVCRTGIGCVRKRDLIQREAVDRMNYTARITPDRLTLFTDTNTSADIIIGNYGWRGRMNCQERSGGESWGDNINIRYNTTKRYVVNITGWPTPGTVVYRYEIRCGNETDDYFNSTFSATLNLTVTWIARPIQFVVSADPSEVLLESCNDSKYVNVTVRNLGVKNITCTASTESVTIRGVSVLAPGVTYNVSDRYRYFNWTVENITNYSKYFNMNITTEYRINWTVLVRNYTWNVPHWKTRSIMVNTGDCSITEYPIHVTCRDRDNLVATKKAVVGIRYINQPNT